MRILERISIEEVHVIYQDDAIWPGQNLLKIPDVNTLSARILMEMKSNPKEFIFDPLSIGTAWYIAVDKIRIGNRYNHGNTGKRGLSFPEHSKDYFTSLKDAERGKFDLITYFKDLDGKSRYGDKTKQAGRVNNHFFLY